MRIFHKSSRSFGDAAELSTKMGGKMPKPVIDSLLEQFTETPNGASKSDPSRSSRAPRWRLTRRWFVTFPCPDL